MNPLEQAIRENNLNQLRLLLDLGYDVNEETEDGEPLLHFAIEKDSSLEIIQTLIDHGADIYQENDVGWSLVHIIARKKNPSDIDIDLIKYLVDKGINVASKDQWSDTPIAWAVMTNNYRAVEALLDCGADVNQNVIDGKLYSNDWTFPESKLGSTNFASLFHILEDFPGKYEEIALLLLDRGATVWDDKYASNSPLIGAVFNQALSVVRLMLKKGVNPNARNYLKDGSNPNYEMGLPIFGAVACKDLRILEELILHGANPDLLEPETRIEFDRYQWKIKASKILGIVTGIRNSKEI